MSGIAPILSAPDIALVAGETSGDLLASVLLQGLRADAPQLTTAGIGGPHMAAQGFQAWWPSEKLAVRGYVEVLRHYREIVGIRRQLQDRLWAAPPKLFVGVDAPISTWNWSVHSKRAVCPPCILCAPRSGHGVPSAPRN